MNPTDILLGILFPIIVGTGLSLALSDASSTEFLVARGCFILAGLEVAGFGLYWLHTSSWPLAIRISVSAVLGAVVLTGTLGVISWIDSREASKSIRATVERNLKPNQARETRKAGQRALAEVHSIRTRHAEDFQPRASWPDVLLLSNWGKPSASSRIDNSWIVRQL